MSGISNENNRAIAPAAKRADSKLSGKSQENEIGAKLPKIANPIIASPSEE